MKTILAFDDFVLNRSDNTKRVFKQPEWRFDCIYTDEEYNPRGIWPSMVVQAPDGGFMMIYSGVPGTVDAIDDEHMCRFIAYSKDGLHFEPYTVNPNAQYPHMNGRICNELGSVPYLDKEETNSEYRYKSPCAPYGYNGDTLVKEPICIIGSPDLIHWKRINDGKATPSFVDCTPSLLHNPVTGNWQMTTRRRWGERRICLVESPDLKNWTMPRGIIHPLPDDEPLTHFYGMPHYYYEPGDIFIGLLWEQVMPFNSIMEGPLFTEYAYSYDGLMWNRTKAVMTPTNLPRGEFGAGMFTVQSMIDCGDEIRFYATAFRSEHGGIPGGWQPGMPGNSAMIPGVLKKNRFVCIDSGKGKAELITQWLRLNKPELRINANIPFGSLKAELRANGQAIEGFGLNDFHNIVGDHLDAELHWRGDLNKLVESGRWFQLHIVFEQAEIYAITGDFDFNINTRAPVYERL